MSVYLDRIFFLFLYRSFIFTSDTVLAFAELLTILSIRKTCYTYLARAADSWESSEQGQRSLAGQDQCN